MPSARIFLHFLDREACYLSQSYDLDESVFVETFETVSMCSVEDMVLSGGHLFEHKAAHTIFARHAGLFLTGQVRLVSSVSTVGEFVELKSDQYAHALRSSNRDYSIYTDGKWKRKFAGPVRFLKSQRDTTSQLASRLLHDRSLPTEMLPDFGEIVENRQRRAITTVLFARSGLFSAAEMRAIDASVSRNYGEVYRELYGGWIFVNTGLISDAIEERHGREYDYRLFRYVSNALNLGRVFSVPEFSISEFRGSIEHGRFVRITRKLFAGVEAGEYWKIGEILRAVLPRVDLGRSARRNIEDQLCSVSNSLEAFSEVVGFDQFYSEVSAGISRVRKVRTRGKTGLSDKVPIGRKDRPSMFVVVAVRQELDAVRAFVTAEGFTVEAERLAHRSAEIIHLDMGKGRSRPIGLLLAVAGGKAAMQELIGAIERYESPTVVLLVGMMAAIKGKARILDVVVPPTIYDVTAQGSKKGAIVTEPNPSNFDASLHHTLLSMDWGAGRFPRAKVLAHKKTVAVSAKIDDISHELAQSALRIDPENIVGLEMEGSALSEKQGLQTLSGGSVGYLMLKGVADYAGDEIDKEEAMQLSELVLPGQPTGDGLDPTSNLDVKSILQHEATRRACAVAFQLLKAL